MGFIINTHLIRVNVLMIFTSAGDYEKVWRTHSEDAGTLKEYASAMHNLATKHWNAKSETRIDWCKEVCQSYFYEGGLERVIAKDERRSNFKKSTDNLLFQCEHLESDPGKNEKHDGQGEEEHAINCHDKENMEKDDAKSLDETREELHKLYKKPSYDIV